MSCIENAGRERYDHTVCHLSGDCRIDSCAPSHVLDPDDSVPDGRMGNQGTDCNSRLGTDSVPDLYFAVTDSCTVFMPTSLRSVQLVIAIYEL